MPTPVIMPKFEMAQETGKVLAWLKREGDAVNKGDPLLEVETDKVNQEVESPATGILFRITAAPGEVVPIAAPIAYILKPGENAADATSGVTAGSLSSDGAAETVVAPSQPAAEAGDAPRVTPLAARLAQEFGVDLHTVVGTGPMGRITREDVEAAAQAGYTAIVTADHGTVEKWLYPDGAVDTGHTNSPVPFVLLADRDALKQALLNLALDKSRQMASDRLGPLAGGIPGMGF